MKKFESLGRILTKDEQKKFLGGMQNPVDAACVDCGGGHLMCGDGNRCIAVEMDHQLYCTASNGNLVVYSCP